jgi:hypothetical protein
MSNSPASSARTGRRCASRSSTYRLEAVARLDRALAAYMVETSLETAGAAIDQLKGNGDAPLARSPLEA